MATESEHNFIEAVKRLTAENGKPPDLDSLSEELGVRKRTLYNTRKWPIKNNKVKVITKDGTQKKWYAPPDYEPDTDSLAALDPQVREAIEFYRRAILRDPTVKEIGEYVGRNPESDVVKTVVYRVGKEEGWNTPDKDLINKKKQELQRIVEAALAIKYDWGESELYPGEREQVLKQEAIDYINDNEELLEQFEATVPVDRGKVSAPPKLAKHLENPTFYTNVENIRPLQKRLPEDTDEDGRQTAEGGD